MSDLYIVFGSSYIKGRLINFLIKNKAINIHMGISPYYRGSDCNFWSLYDNNFHLVGGTVHLISKGLDSGPILFHTRAKKNKNPHSKIKHHKSDNKKSRDQIPKIKTHKKHDF